MEVLRLQNVSKYYTTASSVVMGLTGVNLSFSVGEFVAVTGESGSGKSTLAHVLGGILPYESGEMYVYGQPTSHYDAADWERYRRDTVSFISQNYGILAGNTVTENVESALRLIGMDRESAARRAEEILAQVELTDCRDRRAGHLSSGQKQRLAIARALAKPSKILIADEPTGNLDRENGEKVISLLKAASAERLVILITHEFEEAKAAATRRVILTDGQVVTDVPLGGGTDAPRPADEAPPVRGTAQRLGGYVARLTAKSRPVFTALLCLFLTLTALITFIFLGNFVIASDDAFTRVYDGSVFPNGDERRLVVMGAENGNYGTFGEEDYEQILALSHVSSVERYGYVSDVRYFYREGVDYRLYQDTFYFPEYDILENPDAYEIRKLPEFLDDAEPIYMQGVPAVREELLTAGRLPTGFYEVLSADPSYRVGDTVEVFFRDTQHWGISTYVRLLFDVVGETNVGEGLYFSDTLAAQFNYTVEIWDKVDAMEGWEYPLAIYTHYFFAPYDPARTGDGEAVPLEDGQFLEADSWDETFYPGVSVIGPYGGASDSYGSGPGMGYLQYAGRYRSSCHWLLMVTEATYQEATFGEAARWEGSDQISVYIEDYAYTDRVAAELHKLGYSVVSPYRIGTTEIDPERASERVVTLAVCLGALVLTVILQWILLRAMFSSLYEYDRLLSHIGMTARTAYVSHALFLFAAALVGEIAAGICIGVLNGAGFARVVNIFKYLEPWSIALLFVTHLASVALALLFILRAVRRAVFAKERTEEDMDFTALEEVSAP